MRLHLLQLLAGVERKKFGRKMEVGKLQVAKGEGLGASRKILFRRPTQNYIFYCIKFSYLHFPTINFMLVSKLYKRRHTRVNFLGWFC